jgi:hypothetical protein
MTRSGIRSTCVAVTVVAVDQQNRGLVFVLTMCIFVLQGESLVILHLDLGLSRHLFGSLFNIPLVRVDKVWINAQLP